jgi:hypothetical protein
VNIEINIFYLKQLLTILGLVFGINYSMPDEFEELHAKVFDQLKYLMEYFSK